MALFTVGSLNIEAAVAPPPPKGWACSASEGGIARQTVFRVYIKFLFCGGRWLRLRRLRPPRADKTTAGPLLAGKGNL